MAKFIIGILTIFVLGTVSGAFIGARIQDGRHGKLDTVESLDEDIFDVLKRELALDPAQARDIEPMVAEACVEIREVYVQGAADIERIVLKYHNMIALELTPEQDKIFKRMESERQKKNNQADIVVP